MASRVGWGRYHFRGRLRSGWKGVGWCLGFGGLGVRKMGCHVEQRSWMRCLAASKQQVVSVMCHGAPSNKDGPGLLQPAIAWSSKIPAVEHRPLLIPIRPKPLEPQVQSLQQKLSGGIQARGGEIDPERRLRCLRKARRCGRVIHVQAVGRGVLADLFIFVSACLISRHRVSD